MRVFRRDQSVIYNADVADLYSCWDLPVVIVCDGPYGISGFLGDPPVPEALPDWYEPHIEAWSRAAAPLTTLWFWNTEIGWASGTIPRQKPLREWPNMPIGTGILPGDPTFRWTAKRL
jgi:hypothetical protein